MLWAGFTWMREYEDRDFTIKFQYRVVVGDRDDQVHGPASEWIEVTRTNADLHPEDPWKLHYIDI